MSRESQKFVIGDFAKPQETSVRNLQKRHSETPKTTSSQSKSPKVVLGFAAHVCFPQQLEAKLCSGREQLRSSKCLREVGSGWGGF